VATGALALFAALGAGACGPPTFDIGTPFVLTSTVPPAAASGVGLDVVPRLSFSEQVKASTADGAVDVLVDGKAVARTVTVVSAHSDTVEVIPKNTFPKDTDVTVAIHQTLQSSDGIALGNDVEVTFHTTQ
jgi:hypothetical protein